METYKKWIIIVVAVAVAGIIIVSYVSNNSDRAEKPSGVTAGKSPMPSGPLLDKDFRKVVPVDELDVDRTDPQALSLLGDKYFEGRKFDQAIEIYKKVLELDPKHIDTYNDLGLAYHYTKQPELAIDTLKKGAEVAPSFQRIWLSLGFVLMSSGNNEEAASALKKAAELDPATDVGQEAMRMIGLIK